MSKKLPHFEDESHEARFWETHDSTDYLDEFEDDPDTIFARPEAGVIELGKEVWADLVREARRRRTTPAKLAARWIREQIDARRSA